MKAVCSEYKIHNADIHLKEDCDVDDLVDCIEGSRVYIPCIYVLNKIDQVCPKPQFKSIFNDAFGVVVSLRWRLGKARSDDQLECNPADQTALSTQSRCQQACNIAAFADSCFCLP